MCNGVLSKKQDRAESGRRSHDRSWKTYYAVLIASKIVFYKDRRDAIMVRRGKGGEEGGLPSW